MKTLVLIVAVLLLASPALAGPKNKATEKSGAPLDPTVVGPGVKPTANSPASVYVLRPDSPGIGPIGPGTVATTPSVNIASDQVLPPINNYFFQPATGDNHQVIHNGAAAVYKIKVTVNSTLATDNYLRLYNAGTGFNGCASATNLIYEASIKVTTGLSDDWSMGIGGFTSGIAVCVTGGYGTTDVSNATASAINVNIGWH